MEINRALRGLPTVGRRAGTPGEIVQIRINYFTEPARGGGYFYSISIVFPFTIPQFPMHYEKSLNDTRTAIGLDFILPRASFVIFKIELGP